MIQYSEGNNGSGLTVFFTIDKIPDIMKITRYFCKLNKPFVVTESLQNITCFFCYYRYMCKTVLSESQG